MNRSKSKPSSLTGIKIHTLQELSLRLGIAQDRLDRVASDIEKYRYKKTEIDNKGKERIVYPPKRELRIIQKAIQRELLDRIIYPVTFHGGLKDHSTRTNAEPHTGKKLVAEFDIKSFFPNVSNKTVYKTFVAQGCAPAVARMITQLTTTDAHLAQGFLTSPKISVLVLIQIDRRLTSLFSKYHLTHTIWIDNLIVSGSFNVQSIEDHIRRIFRDHGFELKEAIYKYNSELQTVTGAVVNDKVMPPKHIPRSLRKTQYLIGRHGIDEYLNKHKPSISPGRFKIEINGQLSYLLSLNREKYLPLHKWFQEHI